MEKLKRGVVKIHDWIRGRYLWRRQSNAQPVWRLRLLFLLSLILPQSSRAAFLHGETLDKAAEVLAWVALIVAPIIALAVFWLIHILPEKIAEKKKHPQAKAIQTLCLLSLVFGGLLWPLAWLWAYSKPVIHKLAYGTDVDESHGHDSPPEPTDPKGKFSPVPRKEGEA